MFFDKLFDLFFRVADKQVKNKWKILNKLNIFFTMIGVVID
jgi:hypothetical protein